MPKQERRVLTKEERSVFVQAVSLRMPQERIALLLGMSESTLRRLMKRDSTLRDAIAKAAPRSSLKVRQTLYDMATGRMPVVERVIDSKTGATVEERTVLKGREPSERLLEFWCKTQEGFAITERHEHTGPNGLPIASTVVTTTEAKEPTQEDLEAELAAIESRLRNRRGNE